MYLITQPLDPSLIRAFDAAVTAWLEFQKTPGYSGWAACDVALRESAAELGTRLLRNRHLAREVIESLQDGPGEGDVLAALDVLFDMGRLELSEVVRAQVRERLSPTSFTVISRSS